MRTIDNLMQTPVTVRNAEDAPDRWIGKVYPFGAGYLALAMVMEARAATEAEVLEALAIEIERQIDMLCAGAE